MILTLVKKKLRVVGMTSVLQICQNRKKLLKTTLGLSFFSLLLAFISLQLWDESLARFFADPSRMDLWQKARDITQIGLGVHYFYFVIIMSIVLWLIAPRVKSWTKYKKKIAWLKNWTINFFFALLFSGTWLHLVKWAVGRKRPHILPKFQPTVFTPMTLNWDYHSLPSGHAQVLFTVATMAAVLMPRLKFFWFTLAAFFAFTRVVVYAHFLSDVIFGACLGLVATLWLLNLMKKTRYGLISEWRIR